MKSDDPLANEFDRAIGEVIDRYVPTTVLHNRRGDKQWFDARDRKSTRLNSSHSAKSRMPSSA